jgi:hypothetical protein
VHDYIVIIDSPDRQNHMQSGKFGSSILDLRPGSLRSAQSNNCNATVSEYEIQGRSDFQVIYLPVTRMAENKVQMEIIINNTNL